MAASTQNTTLTPPVLPSHDEAPTGTGQAGNGPTATGMPTQWSWPGVYAGALRSTSILLAEPDHASALALTAGLRAAGVGRLTHAGSVADVDDVIRRQPPGHLALVSLAFEDDAFRLIGDLAKAGWLRVTALAPRADLEPIHRAILAGAGGILRGNPIGALMDLPARVHEMSPREIQVLTLVADGRSNKWIAGELELSALTVKSHLARISRKLGTGDRSHLVAIAMRAGVIS